MAAVDTEEYAARKFEVSETNPRPLARVCETLFKHTVGRPKSESLNTAVAGSRNVGYREASKRDGFNRN
ncbi:Hypothetical protein CINCED_3A000522 [Cinara cedri]|uniref:Uncharacterized protein n=1 Tax=Cinara cedri TaxID=506608 RepID=A0A5E4MUK4_9HEMI|nr:Hypothetical protein CINCED_3A000522 [Cinara cedri]